MSPLSNQFILAFLMVIAAAILGSMGIIVLALPMGLVGGFLLIKEMITKLTK